MKNVSMPSVNSRPNYHILSKNILYVFPEYRECLLGTSAQKFFNDKKIPPRERAFLPLIASGESGEVYAVCGVEIAERLKITENTQRVFYIILQKK